jgi:hypothetical protein
MSACEGQTNVEDGTHGISTRSDIGAVGVGGDTDCSVVAKSSEVIDEGPDVAFSLDTRCDRRSFKGRLDVSFHVLE